jgi:quinoprotein glucose dehydrogenase
MVRKPILPVYLALTGMLAPAADWSFATWSEYLGGADASQYSSLKQINKANAKQLGIAWQYSAGPGTYTFDPLISDGIMYVLAKNNSVVALDAATGEELGSPQHGRGRPARHEPVGEQGSLRPARRIH